MFMFHNRTGSDIQTRGSSRTLTPSLRKILFGGDAFFIFQLGFPLPLDAFTRK